ncbi:hypothetical protein TVAG_058200 [Trichomonas vaginalis G3]|uniref:Surface antigen BspA-like n=1 Tax=Trichomonas vaginalis (strain ATCC PRA-98 / G3) TaxID=412133 RepID=A2EQ80_TRIV3|nr:surface antigen family [Trichomonas vaginalis G3]EAY05163.1 hypothetical protein TVAG_058200 [Trichomonas vaginalis G3]KAI5522932.1 surface antigen family [Trichomonas vaginalis G3]|eukprot:XP_001317386.1 hypothetical protein [Trichomonas vaginalis G3]
MDSGCFKGTILKNLFIPKHVSMMNANIDSPEPLKTIECDELSDSFTSVNGILYTKDKKSLVFFPRNNSKSFTTPNFIENIGYYAFGYSLLVSITFTSNIKTIETYAFLGSQLKSMNLQPFINLNGYGQFQNCASLNEITIENGVTKISAICFYGVNISSIVFPNTLKTIGANAFAKCNNLINVTIPSSVTVLGGRCFSPHTNITFEEGSQFISDDQNLIYNSRTALSLRLSEKESYTIPEYVEEIRDNVFNENNNLKTIVFEGESKLKYIDGAAFANCRNLINIILPNSLEIIGRRAFAECISIRIMKFGNKLKTIYDSAFQSCTGLETIEFSECENTTIRDYAFISCTNLKNVIFSNNITFIQRLGFSDCLSLREIVFPSSLENIDTYAFSNTGITNITFPSDSKLTSIGMGCFSKCFNLSHITLPPNVKQIGSNCFENTNITSFTVPNHTEYMSDYVFKGCTNLVKFTIPEDCSLRNIGNLFFDGCSSLSVIECPRSEYFSVDVGALYNKSETILFCFPPASDIKFFNLPQTLRTISSCAFIGCRNLISISIPDDSVRTIEQYAFANCSSLTSINIPKCVENVESSIFFGCDHLRCGVIIENRSIPFISKIISECLLNPKAIYSCDFLTCQCRVINAEITQSLLYAFAIILNVEIF